MRRIDPARSGRISAVTALITLAGLSVTGCEEIEPVVEEVGDVLESASTPRERYARTLERAGLAESALIHDWRASARAALENPLSIPTAYRAVVAIDASGTAQAWRIPVRRGHRVRVRVEPAPGSPPVYLDAFAEREDDSTVGSREDIAYAGSGTTEFDLLPERDGAIIVRAQPTVLHQGRYTITLNVEPSLTFPVAGGGIPDIGSVFGDPRDGGGREHHGIDIFAARGTPVVAGTAGTVSQVETTPIGGRVVWLRTAGPRSSLYYAHLDSQIVRDGSRVDPGDTLGLVGNTGNARTTPPHLHFGVYSRGPVDPMAYVRPISTRLPGPPADSTLAGRWIRTTRAATPVRPAPGANAVLNEVPSGTALRVTGANADWLSVALPDGRAGFIAAEGFETADEPLRTIEVAGASPLWASPEPDSRPILTLAPGSEVAVNGRFDDYLWIRAADGPTGWIRAAE